MCGYNKGYFYIDGDDKIQCCDFGYGKTGHISIFQSYIYDAKSIKYDSSLNPYTVSHDSVKKVLEKRGYKVDCKSLDRDDGKLDVLYFLSQAS